MEVEGDRTEDRAGSREGSTVLPAVLMKGHRSG